MIRIKNILKALVPALALTSCTRVENKPVSTDEKNESARTVTKTISLMLHVDPKNEQRLFPFQFLSKNYLSNYYSYEHQKQVVKIDEDTMNLDIDLGIELLKSKANLPISITYVSPREIDSIPELEQAKKLKLVFPEVKKEELIATSLMLENDPLLMERLITYQKYLPELSLKDTVKLVMAGSKINDIELFKTFSSDKLTDTEIARLLIMGFSPYQTKELLKMKTEILARANDSNFNPEHFSWLKVLANDADIPVDSKTSITSVKEIDFTSENAWKFVSNSKEKLTIPPHLYQIVGFYHTNQYELCPNYNLREYQEYINRELLPAIGIMPNQISNIDPWHALCVAALLTKNRFSYLNIDIEPYYPSYFYDNDLTLIKTKRVGDCEGFEEAFFRIAYYFKSLNPRLKNFYFVKGPNVGGIMPGHTWPAIIIVDGGERSNLRQIKVCHIDQTEFDFGRRLQGVEGEHFKMDHMKHDLLDRVH